MKPRPSQPPAPPPPQPPLPLLVVGAAAAVKAAVAAAAAPGEAAAAATAAAAAARARASASSVPVAVDAAASAQLARARRPSPPSPAATPAVMTLRCAADVVAVVAVVVAVIVAARLYRHVLIQVHTLRRPLQLRRILKIRSEDVPARVHVAAHLRNSRRPSPCLPSTNSAVCALYSPSYLQQHHPDQRLVRIAHLLNQPFGARKIISEEFAEAVVKQHAVQLGDERRIGDLGEEFAERRRREAAGEEAREVAVRYELASKLRQPALIGVATAPHQLHGHAQLEHLPRGRWGHVEA